MPILGIVASGFAGAGTAFEPIASAIPSGGIDTYTFSNIPQNYQHLQLRVLTRGTYASNLLTLFMQLNGDTGNNYTSSGMSASGGTTSGGTGVSQSNVVFSYSGSAISGALNISNTFGTGIIDLLDYSNSSKCTTIRAIDGVDTNEFGGTPGTIAVDMGLYLSTNAITSIRLFLSGGNYNNFTTFSLYGIKAA